MSARSAGQGPIELRALLQGFAELPEGAPAVNDLTLDSRDVRPGGLFLALRGRTAHGLEHAGEAVRRGAIAVLWERDEAANAPPPPPGAYCAPIEDLSRLAGRIADRFFGRPSASMNVTGITGTNGKTTSAYLLAQAYERLGASAAYLGTVGWGPVGALESQAHTTPDAITVHRRLAALRARGVREVAMEVSSHALDQHRVEGVRFTCAAFTNLTRDHLDYHGSMSAYGAAKARLFEVAGLERMVVNVGDEFGRTLARRHGERTPLTAVSLDGTPATPGRPLYATAVLPGPRGTRLEIDGAFGRTTLASPLIGRFNAENSLLAIGCLAGDAGSLAEAAAALADCAPPPGRMEAVAAKRGGRALAVIDYAHTPDALAKALDALREHCAGALWCVFGCGGDRDPGKRRLMGEIADRLADRILLTDDNPRGEDPGAIVAAILAGIRDGRARVIHDRALAIATALGEAASADVVLIAGKGHENYQIYGAERRAFSDVEEARRVLEEAA
ncbi:MAG: UDP-N-acetylmuramoyl-L-alanyl-D-glutamate--2,6-diaminopimelate ligase [Gammaproteobacteria bacterium]|nr:UDP-N-acetylmuramoyl-L-alanyl-D-glutamate--2,6-diaminopimelate ligase [Gammaproteobacteria bacterium]